MKRNRRDHYTPQGYLRGFIHPERVENPKPLWVLDIQRGEWCERSSAAFGWETGFYDYPEDSSPDGTAEGVFLKHENDFPLVRARIRTEGFDSWLTHREALVGFAAMLSTRSPVFLEQAAAGIRPSLASHASADVLARNYSLTTMRAEVRDRSRRWLDLHWVLRFITDPASPVIGCDQSVGMDGRVDDPQLALQDAQTTLFFPVSWDMCLFGSPARLTPSCAEFRSEDLQRLRSFVVKQARRFVVSPVPLSDLAQER